MTGSLLGRAVEYPYIILRIRALDILSRQLATTRNYLATSCCGRHLLSNMLINTIGLVQDPDQQLSNCNLLMSIEVLDCLLRSDFLVHEFTLVTNLDRIRNEAQKVPQASPDMAQSVSRSCQAMAVLTFRWRIPTTVWTSSSPPACLGAQCMLVDHE